MNLLLIRVTFLLLVLAPPNRAASFLQVSQAQRYIEGFNAEDREIFSQAFPNARAWEFLSANMPLFECPDKELEKTYYFRWWTFRKHLQQTPKGWVITEFLPKVSWGGTYNTINCAAGHQIREGRWLRDPQFVRDYCLWWLRKEGRARARGYSSWMADSVLAWCDVTGDYQLAKEWLPDLVENYGAWEKERLDAPTGLFWQNDNADGMEGSISGGGYRPTINSYMYGDAVAIARIAKMCGKTDVANTFLAKAAKLKELVQSKLWNPEQDYFEVRKAPRAFGLFKWRLNDDDALTGAAKASSSSPGPVENLKDGIVPPNSWNWATPHFKFNGHIGTEEWVQYDLDAPTQVTSISLYLMAGGNFALPEKIRVLYRQDGAWKEAVDVKGDISKLSQWNKISFAPVQADAVKLELTLAGTDRDSLPLANVREQLGYVPWYFDLPDPKYSIAWKQLTDPKGFSAPFGLTTAEQRHPGFEIRYDRHECLWNGPVWPFATAQTLTGLANLLNDYQQNVVDRHTYFDALSVYAHSHRLKLEDGKTVTWVDENQNPFTGDWIARACILEMEKKRPAAFQKKGGTTDRGKDYNHSTFCDLVLNGLVGLRPRSDNKVVVNPLIPEGVWDYFCLDRVPYHGRMLTILWDKTGKRYNKGQGLRLFADGKEIAQGETLQRVEGELLLP